VRPKVTLLSAGALGEEVARILASGDNVAVNEGHAALPGSRVVVTAEPAVSDMRAIADRAPASVIVVAGGSDTCESVLDVTLFPAPRVIGAPDGAKDVAAAVEAIALDRRTDHDCLVAGESGYEPARARLGGRGVRELLRSPLGRQPGPRNR
jgi:hypothetical protein